MDFLMVTRCLCLAAWVTVLIYTAPAAWAIAVGRAMYGDPSRLVCFGFSVLTIAFCLRWFLAPGSDGLFSALYIFGAILAILTIISAKSYGRDRP